MAKETQFNITAENFESHPDVKAMLETEEPTVEQLRKAYLIRDKALCANIPTKQLMLQYLKTAYISNEAKKNSIMEYINTSSELKMEEFYEMLNLSDLVCIGW